MKISSVRQSKVKESGGSPSSSFRVLQLSPSSLWAVLLLPSHPSFLWCVFSLRPLFVLCCCPPVFWVVLFSFLKHETKINDSSSKINEIKWDMGFELQ